jgi:hypothetical protein
MFVALIKNFENTSARLVADTLACEALSLTTAIKKWT